MEKNGSPGQKALVDRVFENGYLLLLGVTALMSFRYTTMLPYEQTAELHRIVQALRAALWGLAVVKTAWQLRRWSWKQVIMAALLCGIFAASWFAVHRTFILELAILMIGAWGVDFRKIAKVWFGVCAAALIVTMALALTGVIENLVYYREGRRRISFGIIYPTDFAAHVFFLAAVWAWLRARRITFWEIGGIALLAVFCLVFCDARNTVLCLLLLAAGLLYLKLRRRLGERRGRPYDMVRPLGWALALSGPILAALMILLTYIYQPENAGLVRMDELLSGRLSLGHEGFARYAVTLFGQDIYMEGLGGGGQGGADYFFLDSSYVNILLFYGAAPLACLLGAHTLSALREKRLAAWERLGILAVVALQCMVEHHMIEIAYNLFLLLPLAVSGDEQKKTPV